ncbi:MAG: hypothetical protein ACRDZ8_02620 [Acidimicrobiales bacterium]
MFKRLFWLGIGVTLGFGSSWWITRTVKQRVEQLLPEQVRANLAAKTRRAGNDLRAALADGRRAMHDQESALRSRMEIRRG